MERKRKFTNDSVSSDSFQSKDIDSLLRLNPDKNVLTKGSIEDIIISDSSHSIALDLWDEQVEDGDIIDIFLNDELYRKDFKIKKKRQRLIINGIEDELIIKIIAKNTGRIFPNTVSILVITEENIYQLETKLKKSESASIDIIREK